MLILVELLKRAYQTLFKKELDASHRATSIGQEAASATDNSRATVQKIASPVAQKATTSGIQAGAINNDGVLIVNQIVDKQEERSVTPARIFIDKPIGFFHTEFEKKTEYEKKQIEHIYLGKWIRHQFILTNFYTYMDEAVVMSKPTDEKFQFQVVILRFDLSWEHRLNHLPIGDKFWAIGKLKRFGPYEIELTDCERIELPPSEAIALPP